MYILLSLSRYVTLVLHSMLPWTHSLVPTVGWLQRCMQFH